MKIKIVTSLMIFIVYSNLSYAEINICLTGKVETMLPNYKVAVLNAANLALKENKNEKVALRTYFYDNKPLSPIRAYDQMIADKCSAIVGYEYLSDLILITKIQHNTTIPIFTSYASSNAKDIFPSNIFFFEPTYEYQARKMYNFIINKYGNLQNVLIVTEVNRSDLVRYKLAYAHLFQKNNISYDSFDFISDESGFDERLKYYTHSKQYDYVFVLAGAVGATKVINLMNDHKKIFIGTENFGSSTNKSVYDRLQDKNVRAYFVRNLDFLKPNNNLKKFQTKYFKSYSINPNPLAAYVYDSINIILTTKRKYSILNTGNVLKISFNGVTGVCIKDKAFHRSESYVILYISKYGYIREE